MRQPVIFTSLKGYGLSDFLIDLQAGITVAMIALPLSLAVAIASGAEPASGIVTAIIGGFLISALGGSPVQIGGPTGAFIVVVYGVIARHGYDGLVLATLMAGCILVIGGYFRAGRLIAYVPEAVVNGFTIGIGLIIGTSQLKDFFGLRVDNVPADFLDKILALWQVRETFSGSALAVALGTLVLIIVLRRLAPRFPGLIFALAFGSLAAVLLHLPVETIQGRFGALPNHLPMPILPDFSIERIMGLLPSAFVIAFLAGVESLLSAMVADRMTSGEHRPNAELTAQGAANIASALFGGLPATGAIARTATNIRSGGKTPVAGMVHALTILLVMMVGANLAGYLAMPALAALLVLTAWNMSEVHKWKGYLQEPFTDRLLLVSTLLLTVLLDLTIAIGTGVALGFVIRLLEQKRRGSDWTLPRR